jgi:excisionase family DNA binding protein
MLTPEGTRGGSTAQEQREHRGGCYPRAAEPRAAEVANILDVSPKTISRWAKEGKLPFMRTLGGHRRYLAARIRELAEELREEATP